MKSYDRTSPSRIMAKVFGAPVLFISILVLAGGCSAQNADGTTCSEALGPCATDCQERCGARHPGLDPKGNCDYSVTPPTCMCYFDCGPPRRKCTRGIGFCSGKCDVQCCNQSCASRFDQGVGYCFLLGGIWQCQCQYAC